jgi:Cft2 family RNA processing exonuclease
MAFEASLAPVGAKFRLGKFQRILKDSTFHGSGVGRGFPGFKDSSMATATEFSTRRRIELHGLGSATKAQDDDR